MTAPQPSAPAGKPRRQVAALPWRNGEHGLEVLLITSRDTGRWVTPKGGRMDGLTDAEAAAQEALEEAGVEGRIAETPLGEFHYLKRLKRRAPRPCVVAVYPLHVQRELADWQEREERVRRWMTVPEAAAAVEEADLASLIRALALST